MVNILLLKRDLQTHQSIDEVLIKHNISFKQCMQLLDKFAPGKHQKRKQKGTGEKYISKIENKFYIRKKKNRRTKSFGGYSSLEDAVKVRDYLVKTGWNKNRLNSICEELGVNGGSNN